MTPTIKLLKKARAHIARDGMFAPGRYYEGRPDEFNLVGTTVPNIPCCPFGALGYAANCHPENYSSWSTAHKNAHHALSVTANAIYRLPVVSYSDQPGRTQAEIVNLFDDAIAELEAAP